MLAHSSAGDTYNSKGLPLAWALPLNKLDGEMGCIAMEADAYIRRQDAFPETLLLGTQKQNYTLSPVEALNSNKTEYIDVAAETNIVPL